VYYLTPERASPQGGLSISLEYRDRAILQRRIFTFQIATSAGSRRKIAVRLLLLDFFVIYFAQPARALFNSTPQLLPRDRRAVAQRAQLGPRDLWMDASAEKRLFRCGGWNTLPDSWQKMSRIPVLSKLNR
jgi:hypothetical protein